MTGIILGALHVSQRLKLLIDLSGVIVVNWNLNTVCQGIKQMLFNTPTHPHTHTYIYIYIYNTFTNNFQNEIGIG
jgi:hypothetical protein